MQFRCERCGELLRGDRLYCADCDLRICRRCARVDATAKPPILRCIDCDEIVRRREIEYDRPDPFEPHEHAARLNPRDLTEVEEQ